ncbi:MAG TPA: ABC transporter permease [Candidatus Wallbacteria bacterium]|nr:ABC transporter permease [Candidatus Wallbacteria bacterium]
MFIEILTDGIINFWHNKLRTFLTMLGIIFGVAAVIAMLAIGNGAKIETVKQIEMFGATNILVRAVKLNSDKMDDAVRRLSEGLSIEDAEYIKAVLPFVVNIAPQVEMPDVKVKYNSLEPKANVVGIDENFQGVMHSKIQEGRFIDADDIKIFRRVCVIGPKIRKELFFNEPAINSIIRIDNQQFTVVGVTAGRGVEKGSAAEQKVQIKTRDVESDIYIPITVAQKKFPLTVRQGESFSKALYNRVSDMSIEVKSTDCLAFAKTSITSILKRRHAGTDDFEIIVPLEVLEQSKKAVEIFNLVMVLIASLSLIVGGIGIMNIMLATVTERTREIGIRRAIGATPFVILVQFVAEATIISVFGGLIGIFLGFGISYGVSVYTGWSTYTTFWSVMLSFSFSVFTGVFFGYYPAYKASSKDIIDALRYE